MSNWLVLESGAGVLAAETGAMFIQEDESAFDGVASEIQKMAPSAVIELYELDLTPLGGDIERFHAGTNELTTAIVWKGETYTPYPIQAGGFDKSTSGQLPRPSLVAANVFGTVTALMLQYGGDFTGMKVTRKRTHAKYLDAVNFSGAVNETADPTAEYPDDVFVIEQKVSDDGEIVEFQLASPLDMENVNLPRRLIVQNICPWKYRSAECGYAGPPIAGINDQYLQLPDALTAVEKAFINARNALWAAKDASVATNDILRAKQNAYNTVISLESWVQLNDLYQRVTNPKSYITEKLEKSSDETGTFVAAFYNGTTVSLGDTYRKGDLAEQGRLINYYRIKRFGPDTAAVSAASSALSTAQTNYNAAAATYVTAQSTYVTALNNLTNDPNFENLSLIRSDVCGKRLASCKLRFGANSALPFGGFPGVGLFR